MEANLSDKILVKVVPFGLSGHGNPQDDTIPSFYHDSRKYLLLPSIDITFVSEFRWKECKNLKSLGSGPI